MLIFIESIAPFFRMCGQSKNRKQPVCEANIGKMLCILWVAFSILHTCYSEFIEEPESHHKQTTSVCVFYVSHVNQEKKLFSLTFLLEGSTSCVLFILLHYFAPDILKFSTNMTIIWIIIIISTWYKRLKKIIFKTIIMKKIIII